MRSAYMILDGQWGSTGKGAIAGYLARKLNPDAVVCNFGPNAGHTFVFTGGEKVMTRQLPTGIVAKSVKAIFIGPGSIIDPDVLEQELEQFGKFINDGEHRIYIHERAAVVNSGHKDAEAEALKHISSTRKGTGAAMADKTMRSYDAIARFYNGSNQFWTKFIVNHDTYTKAISRVRKLQIESAQGFELGINSGSHYPYCTGRDVNVYQIMSDCGVPSAITTPFTVVTMRTFPIRVGNQIDSKGAMVGTSGPVYDDQKEVTFDEIGVPGETTTVTGKPRRVFTFSDYGTERMFRSVRPDAIFLNFVNYVSKNPGFHDIATMQYIARIDDAYCRAMGTEPPRDFVKWLGTGPEEKDIIEYGGMLR